MFRRSVSRHLVCVRKCIAERTFFFFNGQEAVMFLNLLHVDRREDIVVAINSKSHEITQKYVQAALLVLRVSLHTVM